MSRPIHVATVAALVLAFLVGGCDRRKQEEPPPPIRPVLSLVVAPATQGAERRFTGMVEARYQAQLGFQTTGRMISRDANVGDRVSKGQQLATLDPVVARLALTSAQADLANAEAQLTNAAATSARQQELAKTQSVSQAQVESAVASRDTAQAKVDQAKASLQKAQEQVGYTTLTSDYDGVIANWNVEVGQVVSQSQSVVTVARPDPRDAVFDVPDDLLARFTQGAPFEVRLLADESLTVSGEVREIAPQSDAATRTRRIRLTMIDPAEAFRLGTTVRLALANTEAPAIELPRSAVLDRDGKTSVWLVAPEGKAMSRPVALGVARGAMVTVTAGLAPGDRVITAGVHSLSEGQPVKLAQQ